MLYLEIAAVLAGLAYVLLAAREKILCWPFGILNAGLSIVLFFKTGLYAESMLYFYYVLAGIYGWVSWNKGQGGEAKALPITEWPWSQHLLWITLGIGFSLALAWGLKEYTNAQMPLIDAHTTIFSFIATYMVTRKILSNWIYWILIDLFSIGLYYSRDLPIYAGLMALYTIIACYGWYSWNRLRSQHL